jgi:MFS family permease
MPLVLIAVSAMLIQQTMATVSKTAVPVLFKAIADDVGFEAELVLGYTWVIAVVSIVVMVGCGAFIIRLGGLRTSQIGCVLMGSGLLVVSQAEASVATALGLLVLCAGLVGVGATVATPASSQILARYAPPRWAPLVFSIKQTGVPVGIFVASLAAPALTLALGWRGAALVLGSACVVIGVALQPLRREFDRDRKPGHPFTLSGVRQTIVDVLTLPGLRILAAAGFAFIGLQAIFTNFTVVYLAEELGYGLGQAGAALGLATAVAVPGRILWGWVSSTLVAPRKLLSGLAVVMAVGAVGMGLYERSWSYTAVMVPLVLVSATALSWHGVLLSEVARIAGQQEAGRLTGGVLAFGTAGQILFPFLFYMGYLAAGYRGAFVCVAVPSAIIAVVMMRAGEKAGTRPA